MVVRSVPRIFALGVALVLAGCGGAASGGSGSPPTGAVSSTGAPGSTAAPLATSGPGSTQAPPVSAAPTPAGGGPVGVCDLVTTAEVAQVLGATDVVAEPLEGGETAYCTYRVGADAVLATSYSRSNVDLVFDAYAPSGTAIAGLGDGAVWSSSNATLFVKSHGALMGITAGDSSMDDATRMELSKQVAQFAVGRM